jgi:rhomboid protease GluP
MFRRQEGRPEICAWCRSLVGVNATVCPSCGKRNPTLWGFGRQLRMLGSDLGFVTVVVYGCSALYIAGLLVTVMLGGNIVGGGNPFGLLSAPTGVLVAFGASGRDPVFGYGMWWTVLSAGWLHGGALHILFNMMSLRNLGPPTADLYGPARMVIIYTAGSVAGFALSSFAGLLNIPFFGAGVTVGASAPIFGLMGGLLYYGQRTGSSLVHGQAKSYLFGMLMSGFIFPGVDNAAHLGGALGGYVAGMFLDPQREERTGHMLVALACLVLTALSILASMYTLGLFGILAGRRAG